MSAARFDNDREYYLVQISGDHSNIKYHDGERWHGLCVCTVELEAAVPDVVLPVNNNDLITQFREAGGRFNGVIITEEGDNTIYEINEDDLIAFIRSLRS